jgi:hypothetical protein
MTHGGIGVNELKERLAELNTKAYYLLVALSFLLVLGRSSNNADWQHPPLPIKLALTFATLAAVIPLQDFFHPTEKSLTAIRKFKVATLLLAFVFTLYWVWLSI